jgi:hypothetical protein
MRDKIENHKFFDKKAKKKKESKVEGLNWKTYIYKLEFMD